MSIANNILEICLKELEKSESHKITGINLGIGKLTGIEPDSLLFCFDVIKDNTPANEAKVAIKTYGIRVYCNSCKSINEVDEYPWVCNVCNNIDYKIINGNEFFIDSINVE